MNYFSELKRRNIFKVAAAYLALAWVMLQVADVIVPALGLPAFILTAMVVIGVIGFPFALFFAWAYELTPQGIKPTSDVVPEESISSTTGQKINYVIIGLLCVAVVFLLVDRNSESEIVAGENSVAVLPFVNLSADNNDQYFSDGLSEELISVLSRIPELKVSGRTSSFSFRGANQDLQAIGELLGVNHILEGSVRKQGDRLRISVQLIRAEDGFNIWSETFDRFLSDIFAVQADIANAISENLAIELDIEKSVTLISNQTENMRVYDLYLESKVLMSRRGPENLKKALTLLDEATMLDPDYAPAWGLLAQAHTLAYYYHEIETTLVGMYLGEQAARRALEIDPASSLAHGALGDILKDKYHWKEAEEQYLLALEYDPQNTEARSQYSQLFLRTGKFSDALPYTEKSVILDPLGTIYNLATGSVLYTLKRFEEGLYYFDKSIEIAGDSSHFPYGVRLVHGAKDDDLATTRELLRHLLMHNKTASTKFFNRALFDAIADPGLLENHLIAADSYYDENPQQVNADNIFAGIVFAALAAKIENYDLALNFLEKESKLDIGNVNHDALASHWVPVFGPIQNTSRFKEIRKRYGMPSYWRTNGWPDYCHPVSDDDFVCELN